MKGNRFLMKCRIQSGGFSGERTFEMETADGEKLIGTASVRYLLDSSQRPLSEDTPEPGEEIDGYIVCRVVSRERDGSVVVDVPSSDVVSVSKDSLIEA